MNTPHVQNVQNLWTRLFRTDSNQPVDRTWCAGHTLRLGRAVHYLLILSLIFSPLAYAQGDASLDDLSVDDLSASSAAPMDIGGEEALLFQDIPSVYGASKYEQKVTEAPSAVTIITADEIRKYAYRTLADILQSVTGFYVTNDRNYSYVGIRGFNRPGDYNSRILLLIDGHRLNDNLYEQASFGTASLIDVDLIDRVEIIRGPSSSLYGTNAFFGVINVITKRGRDIKGLETSTEIGSYESYKGRFTYGDKFQNGLEVLLSGSFYDSDGHDRLSFKEFDSPETNNGVTRNGDDDRAISVFGKLSYKDFTFMGGFQNREKGIPTAAFGTSFNTTRTRSVDERGYVDMRYIHDFANQLNLDARVYYDRFYYRGDYLYDDLNLEDPKILNQDHSFGEWWGTDVKLSKRLFKKHQVTLGGEYRDNFRQDIRNEDRDPAFLYLDQQGNSRSWAVYAQDEFTILDNLILNAGVRYDHYNSFGGTFNPRAALIYTWQKTTFKFLYGEAFRAPSVYERFYLGTGFTPNPDLNPEKIRMYELVAERNLTKNIRAVASAYLYNIDDLISLVPDASDDLLIYKNADKIEAKGIEFELDGKWASGIEGRVSYAFQSTESEETKKRLTNSPQHLAKLNLIVPLFEDKLFAGLDTQYMSERISLSGRQADHVFLTNLSLFAHNFYRGISVSGSIRNIFGESYGHPGSGEHRQDLVPQDGRTFWLRLKYAF